MFLLQTNKLMLSKIIQSLRIQIKQGRLTVGINRIVTIKKLHDKEQYLMHGKPVTMTLAIVMNNRELKM